MIFESATEVSGKIPCPECPRGWMLVNQNGGLICENCGHVKPAPECTLWTEVRKIGERIE